MSSAANERHYSRPRSMIAYLWVSFIVQLRPCVQTGAVKVHIMCHSAEPIGRLSTFFYLSTCIYYSTVYAGKLWRVIVVQNCYTARSCSCWVRDTYWYFDHLLVIFLSHPWSASGGSAILVLIPNIVSKYRCGHPQRNRQIQVSYKKFRDSRPMSGRVTRKRHTICIIVITEY